MTVSVAPCLSGRRHDEPAFKNAGEAGIFGANVYLTTRSFPAVLTGIGVQKRGAKFTRTEVAKMNRGSRGTR